MEKKLKAPFTEKDVTEKKSLISEWKQNQGNKYEEEGFLAGFCTFFSGVLIWLIMVITGVQFTVSGWWLFFASLVISVIVGILVRTFSKAQIKEPTKKDIEMLVKIKIQRIAAHPGLSVYEIQKASTKLIKVLNKWDCLPSEQNHTSHLGF
ncbi:MAG: hypothetical protein LBD11_07120 [Candidatus Peribacteria bacterium]|jgi:hypothetical protein|nr:hypothetical protein [Candidatus Peribacteria bacterium]